LIGLYYNINFRYLQPYLTDVSVLCVVDGILPKFIHSPLILIAKPLGDISITLQLDVDGGQTVAFLKPQLIVYIRIPVS